MNKIECIVKKFAEENHWLICDCDLEETDCDLEETVCKMVRILPAFNKALKQVENIIKKEFINGERCFSCGRKKEKNLSDTCDKCFENK